MKKVIIFLDFNGTIDDITLRGGRKFVYGLQQFSKLYNNNVDIVIITTSKPGKKENEVKIIITSDIHPSELKGIENRLISRFLSGLKVRVASPEFETAKAILKKKIEGRDETVMIEDEVLDFIATKFSSDVRKLEGSLNELFFKAILDNPGIIDLNFARSVFEDEPVIVMEEELNVSRIKKCVCEYYGLTQTQIESKSRTKQIANARHIAVYLCREHLQIPFVKIGIEFGNRDHSTIMSSFEKAKKLMKKDNAFNTAVRQIESKLGIQ